jgi:4-hydroxybenzoate polyprenyltransferase
MAPLPARLLAYQAERFPLVRFVPLIALFAFSSAAYSRLARGAPGFVPLPLLAAGAATAITFFFVLRVLDEHKDREVDRRFRPELPVPRGLVTLAELRLAAGIALGLALALNLVLAPVLLLPGLLVAAWAALMTVEFFVRDWLRAHATAYLLSHMAIMPLIDLYTTGLDWWAAGAPAPHGLPWFLAATFLNGILIEIGRKIRPPDGEREGVDTYTKAWGRTPAVAAWLLTLALALGTAGLAARAIGTGTWATVVLVLAAFACALPAARFLHDPSAARARAVEQASGTWPLVTYLVLGSIPYVLRGAGGTAGPA